MLVTRTRRAWAAVALATVTTIASAGIAAADNIQDAIADGGSVTLVAGSSTGASTTIWVIGNNNDGNVTDPGCNWDPGESPLVLDIVTPAGVTASPDPLSITECGANNAHTVTFTAAANAVSGTATVNIVSSPQGGGGYANQVSIPITVTQPAGDTTPPVISYTLNGAYPGTPDGLNGWWKSDVTLDWTVSEPQSSTSLVLTGCTDVTITADQLPTSYSCSATSTGGSSGPVTVTIKRDGNGPVVSYTSASGTAGSNGWYVSPVTATFTATDAFSGPASQTGTATSSGDGAAVTIGSPGFTDGAGNTTPAGTATSPAFMIDTQAPDTPTFVGGPAAGSSHYFGSVPAAPSCSSDDATSGLAGCVVTGYSTAVGSHTMTATATDNAGHTSTATRTYTVLAWTASGFYRPVDMGATTNSVKAGSTVPLKFELFAGPTELTDVAVIDSFVVREYTCTTGADLDAIEEYTTGGTILRYDTSGDGQFVQNWKVPAGANRCYRATMTADDGTSLTATFKTR